MEHVIHTGDPAPVCQKLHHIPYMQRELMRKEINIMLKTKIIQLSTSAWESPIVVVRLRKTAVSTFAWITIS